MNENNLEDEESDFRLHRRSRVFSSGALARLEKDGHFVMFNCGVKIPMKSYKKCYEWLMKQGTKNIPITKDTIHPRPYKFSSLTDCGAVVGCITISWEELAATYKKIMETLS